MQALSVFEVAPQRTNEAIQETGRIAALGIGLLNEQLTFRRLRRRAVGVTIEVVLYAVVWSFGDVM